MSLSIKAPDVELIYELIWFDYFDNEVLNTALYIDYTIQHQFQNDQQ